MLNQRSWICPFHLQYLSMQATQAVHPNLHSGNPGPHPGDPGPHPAHLDLQRRDLDPGIRSLDHLREHSHLIPEVVLRIEHLEPHPAILLLLHLHLDPPRPHRSAHSIPEEVVKGTSEHPGLHQKSLHLVSINLFRNYPKE